MKTAQYGRLAGGLMVGGTALAAAAYAAYAGVTWLRYGHCKRQVRGVEADSLLDLFIPEYEVVERHHRAVAAPAKTRFAAACRTDMSQSAIVRALFKARELALKCSAWKPSSASGHAKVSEETSQPKELLMQIKAIGWGVLAEIPGHEIVFGAVTQPWVANPLFRTISAEDFAEFREPGYVKIAWTLRADPVKLSRIDCAHRDPSDDHRCIRAGQVPPLLVYGFSGSGFDTQRLAAGGENRRGTASTRGTT